MGIIGASWSKPHTTCDELDDQPNENRSMLPCSPHGDARSNHRYSYLSVMHSDIL